MTTETLGAVYRLVGQVVKDGWEVVSPITWKPGPDGNPLVSGYRSGGSFSVGYLVEKGDRKAFLKAIDLSAALDAPDFMRAMSEVMRSVEFELAIMQVCDASNMDRVVRTIDSGDISIGPNLQDKVPYIILELADGDVRRELRSHSSMSWRVKALHHAATGLRQLHARQIAHQDLKPSNIMCFESIKVFKIGDFGRSAKKDLESPHEDFGVAGDTTYAPPEQLYGQIDPDWARRRVACDLYHLGSMIVFFFLGHGLTAQIMQKLPRAYWPFPRGLWAGSYQDVLPYISNAFTEVLEDFADAVPEQLRDDLTQAVYNLCNPDPAQRGHPDNRKSQHGDWYDLSRYISLFDRLLRKAEVIDQALQSEEAA